MDAIQGALVPLSNVLLFIGIVLAFYGLVGIQCFGGLLKGRCARITDNQPSYLNEFCGVHGVEKICDKNVTGELFFSPGLQHCNLTFGNPNWGATNFDNLPYAMLTIFQIISLEGWSLDMYSIADAGGNLARIYFILLVIIGTYFSVNICVAAISGVFLRVRHEHQILLKSQKRVKKFSFHNAIILANLLKEVIHNDDTKPTMLQSLKGRFFSYKQHMLGFVKRNTMKFQKSFGGFTFLQKNSSNEMSFGSQEDNDEENEYNLSYKNPTQNEEKYFTQYLNRIQTFQPNAIQKRRVVTKKLKNTIQGIVKSPLFRYYELASISINFVILCNYKAEMSSSLLLKLYVLEFIMLITFCLEMTLRIMAHGLKAYWSDIMNVLDVIVVVISFCGFISRKFPNISVVRLLRWFHHPDPICIKSLKDLGSLLFFFMVIMTTFSIIGMQLYGGQFHNFPEGYPRENFDTFLSAMLTWFSVTTTESWVDQMWNAMRPGITYKWVSPFVFVFYFILTSYICIDLVIAIVLENIELSDNQKKNIQKHHYIKFMQTQHQRVSSTRSGDWLIATMERTQVVMRKISKRMTLIPPIAMRVKHVNIPMTTSSQLNPSEKNFEISKMQESQEIENLDKLILEEGQQVPKVMKQITGSSNTTLQIAMLNLVQDLNNTSKTTNGAEEKMTKLSSIEPIEEEFPRGNGELVNKGEITKISVVEPLLGLRSKKKISFNLSDYEGMQEKFADTPWYFSSSALFIFSIDSKLRKFMAFLVESIWYERFVMCCCILSVVVSIRMGTTGSITPPQLHSFDFFLFVVFLLDIIMKSIAYGFLFAPEAYLGDPFNFIDVINIIFQGLRYLPYDYKAATTINIMNGVRVTRFIPRIFGLKLLVGTLLRTIPSMISIFSFTLVIFFIFATIGVQQFRSKFASCTDTNVMNRAECIGFYWNNVGLMSPRVWMNQSLLHFDSFGAAMLSLFVCSTTDNWLNYFLHTSMDIPTTLYDNPKRNHSPWNALFFCVFIVLVTWLVMRMLVGFFIDQFGVISGSKLLTERQRLWRDMNRIIQSLTPKQTPNVPQGSIRGKCYKFVHSRKFESAMVLIILGNFVYTATQSYDAPRTRGKDSLDTIFVFIYLIEVILKLVGNEFRDWMIDWWNWVELLIALGSASCLFPSPKETQRILVGNLFAIVRIFRIIRYIPTLNTLVNTIMVSLPSLIFVIELLGISIFEFSIIFGNSFENMAPGNGIGNDINFQTFVYSFVTIFQISTADNWSVIMTDSMLEQPFCVLFGGNSNDRTCGYPTAVTVYYVVIIFLNTHIITNIFIAQIIDKITFGLLNENAMVTPKNLLHFQNLWAQQEYDPSYTYKHVP
ncbi:unnamed protein product [Sphagnum troendelagicum]